MRALQRALVAFVLGLGTLGFVSAWAQTGPITFDDLAEGTDVGNAYANSFGVTFSNALVVGVFTGNQIEYPPLSGNQAITDENGAITLTFSQAITSFTGYFTYAVPVTLSGYDATNTLVASITSQDSGGNTLNPDGVTDITPGANPNELITLSSSVGFTSLTLSGDPNAATDGGGDFTVDDVSFTTESSTTPPVTDVPEIDASTGHLALALLVGVLLLAGERRRRYPRPG